VANKSPPPIERHLLRKHRTEYESRCGRGCDEQANDHDRSTGRAEDFRVGVDGLSLISWSFELARNFQRGTGQKGQRCQQTHLCGQGLLHGADLSHPEQSQWHDDHV
jgi:hypothetical protein